MTETFTGRRNHGRGHSYWIDGAKVDGVTTIISNGLPKTALVKWAAETAAGYAVDNWDDLAAQPPSERLKRISKAHDAARSAAAVRGTQVHALAERLAAGDEVTVPDELAGHVESCVRFLDEWDVRPLYSETAVLSAKWRYGGSFDLIADLADGKRYLLDWKTNKSGPFGDTAFQLAAYRYADFCLLDGPVAVPEVDACAVVWLRADGYDLHPYEAGPDVFRQFLYIQQCARAAAGCRDYRMDALLPPVRTEA